MNFLKKSYLSLGIVLCAVIGIMANVYPVKSTSEFEATAQDVISLDRRISSIEQRLYSIESNISRLQQSAYSSRSPTPQPSDRDREINLIRGDIQTLQLRLNEIECGLVKLDERTAVPVRENRASGAAKAADPCRLNPGTPLHLSTRP
jgi:predicted RNase H-like nuclease (RuvC/YqgF family)